jgi:16S rRNA (cytosine(967)-C(5))-methyltransferase
MKTPFRHHHLLSLLKQFDQQSLPLDLFISLYFREHTALGSKDRAFISEAVYSLIRWKGLIDYLLPKPITWERRCDALQTFDPNKYFLDKTIPAHIRCSFPEDLFRLIQNHYGEEKAQQICLASNHPAPTTVRVNLQKIDRDTLLKRWKDLYAVSATQYSPWGIIFHKKIHFFSMPEFKEGLFEIQDEGSQLIAQLVQAEPGQQILDYCSGAGGKSLAFAPLMENKGQIFLHDIRSRALQEAKKRLRRAGVQNAQLLTDQAPGLNKLKKKMDWVLADVPCSGTGTLRRNPDLKWRFEPETLQRLVGQQRMIFEKALSYLSPKGRIVYATCSLLPEENEQQLEHFINTYQLSLCALPFQSIPKNGEMDGFFGAVLEKKILDIPPAFGVKSPLK